MVAHWHDIHKGATVTTLPEIYDITDNSNSVDGGSTTTEKMDTVKKNAFMQPEVVEPMFVRAMAICPQCACGTWNGFMGEYAAY